MKVKIELSIQNEVNRFLCDMGTAQELLMQICDSKIQAHLCDEVLRAINIQVLASKNTAELSYKRMMKLKLNTLQCYVLYKVFMELPETVFMDLDLIRKILLVIDQAIPVQGKLHTITN